MAVLNLTQMAARVQTLVGDTAGQVATLAVATDYINEALYDWFLEINPRRKFTGGASAISLPASTKQHILATAYAAIDDVQLQLTQLAASARTPLELPPYWEAERRQYESPTAGVPNAIALQRIEAAGTPGSWMLIPHPIPDVEYFLALWTRAEPTALTGSAVPDVTDAESYWIARVAAARLAPLLNRSADYISDLWRGMPEKYASIARRQDRQPRFTSREQSAA